MTNKKQHSFLTFYGFMGFIGFLGFQYFKTGEIRQLSFFAFFGFFAYFFVGRIASSIPDELFLTNSRKAKAFTYHLALLEFTILFLITPLSFISKELLTVISSLCFASLIIVYAIVFYINERFY